MTTIEIAELRALLAKAVPESDSGWYISNVTGSGLSIIEDGLMFPGSGICPIKCEPPQAELIVAAINALPALLDRLEAGEGRISEYVEARAELEVAPTHNGPVFDAAMERYKVALAALQKGEASHG